MDSQRDLADIDITGAESWSYRIEMGHSKNFLVLDPDYSNPIIDEEILLPIDDPSGLYRYLLSLCEDPQGMPRKIPFKDRLRLVDND